MLGTSLRRVFLVSCLSLASVAPIHGPAQAVTILLPAQLADDTPLNRTDAAVGKKSSAVSQAALLPVDDQSAMWALLAAVFALVATAMQRKRRMPSVTA